MLRKLGVSFLLAVIATFSVIVVGGLLMLFINLLVTDLRLDLGPVAFSFFLFVFLWALIWIGLYGEPDDP